MHSAVARLVWDEAATEASAVLVPTAEAALEFRRTLERRRTAPLLQVLPDLLTRAAFYDRLQQHGRFPALLTPQAREVLLRRAARAAASHTTPPFNLRPGLVQEMLRFYDELLRRGQTLGDFNRKVTDHLAVSAGTDRGAERLLRQTAFLEAAFREFERLSTVTQKIDEHRLRALLLSGHAKSPYGRVIVTVADQAADSAGLFSSDFDLLAQLDGIVRLDVIATENLLASGFHERVHDMLPGIEEEKFADTSLQTPTLWAPASDGDDRHWFTCRDREEELVEVARDLRQRSSVNHSRCAIVFQRPLPYLYLAQQVFGSADLRYQSGVQFPLSTEPCAAAVDLVLSFLTADGNRESTIALLASPQFAFRCDAKSIAALDRRMLELKFAGGWERLNSLPVGPSASAALAAAVDAALDLTIVRTAASAVSQLDGLLAFLAKYESLPQDAAPWRKRHARAREQIVTGIEALRDAHAAHDDQALSIAELAAAVRRSVEAQTFAPDSSDSGVRLLDAVSAPYADVEELRIVGLVESDWPEPAERSIFYPAGILSQLGWPMDARRSLAARARFRDLITLPHQRVSGSSFTLEDDAIVAASPFVEELELSGLSMERRRTRQTSPVFVHERLSMDLPDPPIASDDPDLAEWLQLRQSRTPSTEPQYQGSVGPRPARQYAVSHVERYLECPFKYYAAHVLGLPEERGDESGLTPQERGRFIHEVFEQFFRDWQHAGHGTITANNVGDAVEMFERVVDSKLSILPEADRSLERTHLVGSAAAAGLAERAFAFEIEQGGEVLERLLEYPLEGTFRFNGTHERREVAIRAKADRIDLMADGTLRVIDYKLGRAPKASRALQLSIYGTCAEQALDGRAGRSWTLARAGYVAFKEKDSFVPLGGRSPLNESLKDGQQRFLDAIDAIERGEFPVRPEEPFRCQWCSYAGVCRKDYVGDE